jgi:benzoyl-CoA reductase/2-hydroxyglutaryl-CoA dehydratase subunit BcrC/BadD/HgdB
MYEERLSEHLKNRPAQLEEAKKKGVKIIGYFPGNYVPEEIIYASGAVPVCLAYGGNPALADAGTSLLPNIICPFARAQIGERLLKSNPYYSMIDTVVAPITCQHLRKVAEIWEYYGDIEIFKLGIPHQYDGSFELEYYTDRLRALKDRLQVFTGNKITNEKISEAIDLYNNMRDLLKKICLMRRASAPPLSALDFIRLNHSSFFVDPAFMVSVLGSAYRELNERQGIPQGDSPRLMLLGPNLSFGDNKILELTKTAGGEIVIEDLFEGIRYYWQSIEQKGDLIQSLAKGYLADRVPCALMRDSAQKRLNFALKLVSDFNVSGVIWYELLNCEAYDSESYFFASQITVRQTQVYLKTV